MLALKIRERCMAQDIKQAEIMGDAARTLVRIQDEIQARIDCALLRPSSLKTNDDHHVAWLESFKLEYGLRAGGDGRARQSFKQEDRLRAQVEVAERAMGVDRGERAAAFEVLLITYGMLAKQRPLESLPLLEEVVRKAEEVQMLCLATMDCMSATTRLVSKDRQYALQMQCCLEDLVDQQP